MKDPATNPTFDLARTTAMPQASSLHPSAAQLRGFAQGRLPPETMADVESHVATCDVCCRQLEQVPDDTLVQLAREAATFGFRNEDSQPPTKTPPSKSAPGIPPELADHPRYRVLGVVGTGGMGAVYKAEHRLMERLVALKVINPTFLKNAAAVERFQREFKSAARLSHPNVVTAYDAERAGDLHFLVMEFVEGLPLDRLVQQAGPLPVARACHIIHQAALGLQHAHDRGMVHRDIKPQNLMVGRKGQVKVLDFGLARLVTDEDTSATTEGMILGTPDYIAPEQAANARAADIRSDIYSLGGTLYFALTGQPPFPKGSFVEKLTLHATKEPEPITRLRPDVPPELAQTIARMMAKQPANRYQTPAEVAKELAAFVRGQRSEAGGRKLEVGGRGDVRQSATALTPLPPIADPAPLDPLAGLDLAAATPLRPVVKGGHGPSAGLSQQQLITLLAVAGVAVVLFILAVPLANWLWPGPVTSNANPPGAQPRITGGSSSAKGAQTPPRPPDVRTTTASAPPVAAVASDRPSPGSSPSPGTAAGTRQYRALFIIPTDGLYGPDYLNTRRALEGSNLKVHVAALTDRPSTFYQAPGERGPTRDVPYGDNLRAADYDCIIFTGYETMEFSPRGPAADTTRRLIKEFKQGGKLVTAICRGQQVLAEHGELRGKKVAKCQYVDAYPDDIQPGGTVAVDGHIVTASRDQDAWEFVVKIVETLDAR